MKISELNEFINAPEPKALTDGHIRLSTSIRATLSNLDLRARNQKIRMLKAEAARARWTEYGYTLEEWLALSKYEKNRHHVAYHNTRKYNLQISIKEYMGLTMGEKWALTGCRKKRGKQ